MKNTQHTFELLPQPHGKTPHVILASQELKALLSEPQYRKLWSPYLPASLQDKPDSFSYRSIARAISVLYHRKYGKELDASRFKDRVRRALMGQKLTTDTLRLFADSFDFTESESQRVLQHLAQEDHDRHRKVNYRYLVNSCMHDVYVNEQMQAEELHITFTVQTLSEECDSIFLHQCPWTDHIVSAEGCTWEFREDLEGWFFYFPHVLAPLESIIFRVVAKLKPQEKPSYVLASYTAQTNISVRIFFPPQHFPHRISVEKYDISHQSMYATNNKPLESKTREMTVNRFSDFCPRLHNDAYMYSWGKS